MNTKKVIDVGITSSLVELKAEVLRKQAELKASAPSSSNVFGVQKTASKKLPKIVRNAGVDKRSERDKEVDAEEEKTLDRARYVLEQKAKLYDKMNRRETLGIDDHEHPVLSNSLVDFQRKVIDNITEDPHHYERPDRYAEANEEDCQVDEAEWTEFTDSLGRTRRCLKSDLPEFISRDEEMAKISQDEPTISPEDELKLRKHVEWQKKAEEVAMKTNVHYQDVLYDEIRPHGVGYFNFSTDDITRQEQIRSLKQMTELTDTSRTRVKQERKEKQKQLKERLKKIRQRKRAKLGLQAEESDNEDDKSDEGEDKQQKDNSEVSKTEEEEKARLLKQKQLRAWDFGKPGVYGPKPVNFDELDEKWLKDKRSERHREFAPPSLYSQNTNIHPRRTPGGSAPSSSSSAAMYSNFVKGQTLEATPKSQQRVYEPLASNSRQQHPQRIRDELPAPSDESNEDWKRSDTRRRAEIAPPPTFEYYHGGNTGPRPAKRRSDMDEAAIAEAVTMGLRNLKKKLDTPGPGEGDSD